MGFVLFKHTDSNRAVPASTDTSISSVTVITLHYFWSNKCPFGTISDPGLAPTKFTSFV